MRGAPQVGFAREIFFDEGDDFGVDCRAALWVALGEAAPVPPQNSSVQGEGWGRGRRAGGEGDGGRRGRWAGGEGDGREERENKSKEFRRDLESEW